MNLEQLKCISNNVNLEDYLQLYKYVRENMKHPEWLGTFTKNEIKEILSNGGKIWLYYNDTEMVCSMLYIPSNNNSLKKHNIEYDEIETAALGPIMVSPNYIGNGFQNQMIKVFEEYCRKINKKYIFTKVCSDNFYSINNFKNNGYILIDKYFNERGKNFAFIKII